MGRMKQQQQEIFNVNWREFLADYKKQRVYGDLTPTEKQNMIVEFNLVTTNGFITLNKLSKRLNKNNILTGRVYKTKLIKRGFLFMIRHHPRAIVVKSLALRFKTDGNSINDRLRKMGLGCRTATKSKAWQINAIKMIKEGFSYKEISKETAQPTTNVIAFLRNHSGLDLPQDFGVRGIQFKYRDLQEISPENAHLQGFVWADGSVQAGNEVVISISSEDKAFLSSLANSLVKNGRTPKVSIIKTKQNSERFSYKDRVGISIARKSYAKFLIQLGMPQNKEKTTFGFPEYIFEESALFWAFFRGFFEGDGTITAETISLSVNYEQAVSLNLYFEKTLGFSADISNDKSIYRLGFGTIPKVMLLIAGMYSIGGIKLERKMRKSRSMWNKYYKNYGLNYNFDQLTSLPVSKLHKELFEPLRRRMTGLKYKIKAINQKTEEVFVGYKSDFVSKIETKVSYVTRVERRDRNVVRDWKIIYSEKYDGVVCSN